MKHYLAIFVSLLILSINSSSLKYNPAKLASFLKNIDPNLTEKQISDSLTEISNDKKLEGFRFKSSSTSEEKSNTSLPLIAEGWMRINTEFFNSNNEFPAVMLPEGSAKIRTDDNFNCINEAFTATDETRNLGLDNTYFYFRLNSNYIFFSSDKSATNVIFVIKNNMMKDVTLKNDDKNCIGVKTLPLGSKKEPLFLLCNPDKAQSILLTCLLQNISKSFEYKACFDKNTLQAKEIKTVKRIIKQPFIVIPTPQRMCNQGWTYASKGNDWECICKEGKEQSPIDLPDKDMAIRAPAKPLLRYNYFNEVPNEVQIQHRNHGLVISTISKYLKGFGELVTPDGTIYFATDIIFHTPSEHTIKGKRFPLEIQILHEAKTKGDFGKKAYLNFLFEGKPGVYNKFLDDIEFFNLPNPHDAFRNLKNKLYIPDLFKTIEDSKSALIKPFSFYTYQGSLTQPPCTEKVIHYTTANPIQASITSLDLIREALRMPDFEDIVTENIVVSKESVMDIYREAQALNGRPVFLYDSDYYEPADEPKKLYLNSNTQNHYEKVEKDVTEYIYVQGNAHSGIPGAVIVSEDEAKAK